MPTVRPTSAVPTNIPTPSCTSDGVSLSPSTLTLKVGESSIMTATNDCPQTPSGITWSSSDGSIATVDGNGLVKAISVGSTVTITATNSVGKKATASVVVITSGNRTLNFKISFSGIKPSYVNTNGERYNCLASLGGLSLEIANVPTNKYETFSDIQFSVVGNEVDSLGNQVFQVSNLPIGSALDGVNNFNYVKVKGPFHLKRRMCLDNQTGKLTETTVCNIDLNKNDGYIYDFSEYNLLAGDVDLNGIVNGIDFVTVKNSVNAGAEPVCGITNDLNMDGVVNGLDLSLIRDISLAQVDDE